MRFEENFIIQLPVAVKNDSELNWTDRIAFFFFVRYEGDAMKVLNELQLTSRRLRMIKARLANRGHITQIVDEKGQIRYIPIDVNSATWDRIKQLREKSLVGFKKIGDQNILAWQRNHSLQFILQQMEVVEWTYRKSKLKKIEKPHALIATILKNNGTIPPDDFVPGFWENDAPKEKQNRKPDIEEHREAAATEAFVKNKIREIREASQQPTSGGVRG